MKKPLQNLLVIFFLVFGQNSFAETQEGKTGIQSEQDLNAYLETFRSSRSLLKKGQFRFSESLSYQFDGNSTIVSESFSRVIGLYSDLEYGLTKNTGVYGAFSYSDISQSFKNLTNNSVQKSSSEPKFFKLGFKRIVSLEENNYPEIILDFSLSNTRQGGKNDKTFYSKVNLIKSFDPIVLLGGVGFNYGINSHDKYIDLTGGIGFGINDKIALGSDLSWSIPVGNGFDSKKDVTLLSGRVTITSGKNVFEPSISFGLTEFSPDMSFGFSWSKRF